jgi:hypothetical protein
MEFDAALDAILALEELWRERNGQVHLSDLGVGPYRTVRMQGNLSLPPERWRGYPGARLTHQA